MADQKTGTDNVTYNLTSVLYHTLQQAETIDRFIRDAQSTGDHEVVGFFREIQQEDRRRGDRAKALLRKCIEGGRDEAR